MTRRIRVLFFIDSFNSEAGTENQLIEIIRRMDTRRFELFAACFEDGDRLRGLPVTPLVFPVHSVFSFRGLWQLWRACREIRRRRIDIAHTFMTKATIVGVVAARCAGCPAVITSRRNLGYWYSPFYLFLFRLLNRLTSRVLANSEGARRSAIEIERINGPGVDVIYNGVDVARFSRPSAPAVRERLGIPPNARVVGVVANYRPVKDLATFLRAAHRIAARHSDAAFLLAGKGPLREELGRLAETLNIAGKVFFTDGAGDVADYLPLLHVACLSSTTEGFSNAILEYMAAGLPVVATDVGGNAEAVTDGVTGYIVPAGATEAFAEAVDKLLDDDELRRSMGVAGRRRCREAFDIGDCVRRYERYYGELLRLTESPEYPRAPLQ